MMFDLYEHVVSVTEADNPIVRVTTGALLKNICRLRFMIGAL